MKASGWRSVINARDWDYWMSFIASYHSTLGLYQPIHRAHGIMGSLIKRVHGGDPHWDRHIERTNTPSSPLSLNTSLDQSPPPSYYQLQGEYSSSLELSAASTLDWCPEVDEIVYSNRSHRTIGIAPGKVWTLWSVVSDPVVEGTKLPRTIGVAPGTIGATRPTTAASLLEDIMAGRFWRPPPSTGHIEIAPIAASVWV